MALGAASAAATCATLPSLSSTRPNGEIKNGGPGRELDARANGLAAQGAEEGHVMACFLN